MIAQLKAITSKPVPGGGLVISSPRRGRTGHGDIASAMVLAVWAAASGEPTGVSAEGCEIVPLNSTFEADNDY